MGVPSYYCPPGIPRPAHVRVVGGIPLATGAGPDGKGGTVYGRPYDPADRDAWELTPGGWWVDVRGSTIADCLRANAIVGLKVGDWLVPQLLIGAVAAVGYWTAEGFQVPAAYAGIVSDLQRLRTEPLPDVPTPDMVALAARILGINYHLTIEELGRGGVLTHGFVFAVLAASVGVPSRG